MLIAVVADCSCEAADPSGALLKQMHLHHTGTALMAL
jgi:hypothetical protein